jgi:hypothetical protein
MVSLQWKVRVAHYARIATELLGQGKDIWEAMRAVIDARNIEPCAFPTARAKHLRPLKALMRYSTGNNNLQHSSTAFNTFAPQSR